MNYVYPIPLLANRINKYTFKIINNYVFIGVSTRNTFGRVGINTY